MSYRLPGGRQTFKDDRAAGRAIADAILKSYPDQTRRETGPISVRAVVRQIPDRSYDPATFVYDNGRGSNAAVETIPKTIWARRNRGALSRTDRL